MRTVDPTEKQQGGLGAPIRKEKPEPKDVRVGKHTYKGKDGKLYTADPKNEEARGFIPPWPFPASI